MNLILFLQIAMVLTFLGAVGTLVAGVLGVGKNEAKANQQRNRLMFWRVGLCGCLLIEILVYVALTKGF